MNKVIAERFKMFNKVLQFFKTNETVIITALPSMINVINSFKADMPLFIDIASTTETDNTGYTKQKKQTRLLLQEETYQVGLAAGLYYTHVVADEVLSSQCFLNASVLQKMRDNDLLAAAQTVSDIALPIKTLLLPYGATQARVEALPGLAATLLQHINDRTEQKKTASLARKNLSAKTRDITRLLTTKADIFMKVLQYSDINLYTRYTLARAIDKMPTTRAIKKSLLKEGEQKQVRFGADYIKAHTKIALHNESARTRGGTIIFYFAADKNSPPPALGIITEVAPAADKTIVAAEAGFSEHTPVLVVKNMSAKKVRWRCRVVLE